MKLEKAVNIEDLHRMARRRLPKIAFDFIEGGLEDERLLMATSLSYRQLEQRTPARALISPVTAHLSLARDLARRATGNQQARLAAAMSEIAGLAAWLHADQADAAQARRFYKMSIATARQAGHPLLAIYMQSSFGQYATTVGDPASGLRLICARSW